MCYFQRAETDEEVEDIEVTLSKGTVIVVLHLP
jgi:hypothetical protein